MLTATVVAFAALNFGPAGQAAGAQGVKGESNAAPPLAIFGEPLPGTLDANEYHVGPGDQFQLWIWGPISRQVTLTVGPEGDILIPDIGSLHVSGSSLAQTRARIIERVRRSLSGVEVDVQLARLRTFRVYLTGQLQQTGPVIATGTSRVADVLPDSSFLPDGSRRNIVVHRRDGSELIVDLQRFLLTGEESPDQWLTDGDIITVPIASSQVGAWGAVGRPGKFELGPSDSVGTLLRMAGGLLNSAFLERALLVRWRTAVERETLVISLGEHAVSAATPLRDGDQLYVFRRPGYHESQQVTVLGRVPREGVFPIRLGLTRVADVLEAAGGFLPDADRASLHLIRRRALLQADPEFDRLLRLSRSEMTGSEYEAFRARLAALSPDVRIDGTRLAAGPEENLLLQDGDILRVERRTTAVRVDGQVARPGLVPFAEGQPYGYYLRLAGGYTARAARTQVRVTRTASGQTIPARDAHTLLPGDQVWVPERPEISPWAYLRDALVVVAQLATVYLAVKK